MEREFSPNPDSLLESIKKEEQKSKRGQLKVYLGMAPGVGKTYSMLQYAHELYSKGVNVYIGYVEPHKRDDTEKLLANLPFIPTLKVQYGTIELQELNVDEILKIKPDIVLVDELAHTNAPNLRHKKRYEDVIELLEAGISVHTTLNVQHIESRRDVVAKITGVLVQETVPDSVLDYVTEFELVDLSPNELLQRIKEGKVYQGEAAVKAQSNFFTLGNLIALRELALRVTSERVEIQLDDFNTKEQIVGPWKSGEKFLTALGPSPYSANLLRWTKRLASNFNARWYAVYVDTLVPLSPDQEKQLRANLELARDLGAVVIKTVNVDVVEAIIAIATEQNITQLVIGKSPNSLWKTLIGKQSLLQKLLKYNTRFDIHIVPPINQRVQPFVQPLLSKIILKKYEYTLAPLSVIILAGLLYPFTTSISYQGIGMLLLLLMTVLPLFFSRGPVVLSALLSSFIWNFFFIPPIFSLRVDNFADVMMLILSSVIALVCGYFTTKISLQSSSVKIREKQASFFSKVTNLLTEAYSLEEVVQLTTKELSNHFNAMISMLTPNKDGTLVLRSNSENFENLGTNEMSVAQWAYTNNKTSGKYTKNIPSSHGTYIPIVSQNGVLGIVGIEFKSDANFNHFIQDELFGIIPVVSTAFEREIVRDKLQQKNVQEVSENLYKTIINTLSHEFKTPISVVSENASHILNQLQSSKPESLKEVELLAKEVITSTDRLTRLVNNLLDISRIENGRLTLKIEWCDIYDVIGTSVQSLKDELQNHTIETDIQTNFPLFSADIVLLSQAISNIIHNSCKYTPNNSTIVIRASFDNKNVYIAIEDNGLGIKPEFISLIFDKFYRVPGVIPGGTGLGLAITKSIIESHSGNISVQNKQTNGVIFSISIPTTFQEVAIIE